MRGLAFCHLDPDEASPNVQQPQPQPLLLLASVSQDKYGRIWRLVPDLPAAAAAAAADVTAGGCDGTANGSGMLGAGDTAEAAANSSGMDPLAAMIVRYAPKPSLSTGRHRCGLYRNVGAVAPAGWLAGTLLSRVEKPCRYAGGICVGCLLLVCAASTALGRQ